MLRIMTARSKERSHCRRYVTQTNKIVAIKAEDISEPSKVAVPTDQKAPGGVVYALIAGVVSSI